MAYLPPAGIRLMTADKRSDLILQKEVPAIFSLPKRSYRCAPTKQPISIPDCPPRDQCRIAQDWQPPTRPNLDNFTYNTSSQRARCCGAPCGREYDHGAHATDDPCDWLHVRDFPPVPTPKMFEGKTDVKRRADWIGQWQQEYLKYSGALGQWQKMHGKRYFYQTHCSCARENTKK